MGGREERPMPNPVLAASAVAFLAVIGAPLAGTAKAEDFSAWPLLTRDFESTGGGGVRILDYDPVVADGLCRTAFRARLPDGQEFSNTAEFDAVPADGGILCTNGRWRAADGGAEGTTPFRVFIKDGVKRGR
jgi:hypothetical protein